MKESTLWKEYNWLYQKFTRTIDSIYKGCIDWMKKERLTLPRPILENFKMKFAISSTDSEEEPCRQKQRNRVLITEKTWKHNARFFFFFSNTSLLVWECMCILFFFTSSPFFFQRDSSSTQHENATNEWSHTNEHNLTHKWDQLTSTVHHWRVLNIAILPQWARKYFKSRPFRKMLIFTSSCCVFLVLFPLSLCLSH